MSRFHRGEHALDPPIDQWCCPRYRRSGDCADRLSADGDSAYKNQHDGKSVRQQQHYSAYPFISGARRHIMLAVTVPKFASPSAYTLSGVDVPTITEPDERLIKVHAASINPIDVHMANDKSRFTISET